MTGDIVDKAQVINEQFTEMALKKRKEGGPKAKGECYFCEEPLGEGLRWCDDECRDDWKREIEALGRR